MSDFWSKQELLKVIPKNKTEEIRVFYCERQSKEYIDIRIYKEIPTSPDKISTKNGVVIPKEEFLKEIPEILQLLNK